MGNKESRYEPWGSSIQGTWFSSWYVFSIDIGHRAQSPQSGPRWSPAFKMEPLLSVSSFNANQFISIKTQLCPLKEESRELQNSDSTDDEQAGIVPKATITQGLSSINQEPSSLVALKL